MVAICGQRDAGRTRGELDLFHLSLDGPLQRLQRRRGRSQDDGELFLRGAPEGQVAGVVAEALFLLVGRVVLLVDDQEL
jgi:hypothetical protein